MSEEARSYILRIMDVTEEEIGELADMEGAREEARAMEREFQDRLSEAISEAEENITDLLPEGYYAKFDERPIRVVSEEE